MNGNTNNDKNKDTYIDKYNHIKQNTYHLLQERVIAIGEW